LLLLLLLLVVVVVVLIVVLSLLAPGDPVPTAGKCQFHSPCHMPSPPPHLVALCWGAAACAATPLKLQIHLAKGGWEGVGVWVWGCGGGAGERVWGRGSSSSSSSSNTGIA
jgi:hypothetical protein